MYNCVGGGIFICSIIIQLLACYESSWMLSVLLLDHNPRTYLLWHYAVEIHFAGILCYFLGCFAPLCYGGAQYIVNDVHAE